MDSFRPADFDELRLLPLQRGCIFCGAANNCSLVHVLLAVRPMQEALGQRSIPALSLPS